jgi:hypothetical protein
MAHPRPGEEDYTSPPRWLIRAQRNARKFQPAALAFVPYGFVLARVRFL